ncbi:UDP-N-acetylmuramate--L-alanine ligase [Sphingobacterium sp. SYP-B4668]|uniref:UDP-N-acetylmuramate--L-alanine ligase n=1 Tax=Sphingobacterium sp. SYP-B4668 TaxID=2996035 RepID=UPI0022DDD90A|nr:Mur ligase family protein [Sphingobacterium sp. SYP-B4668]
MRIHFIAIGGSVMHNLAISLAEQGHQITGSDDQIVEPSRSRLMEAHLLPAEIGWFPQKITTDIDAVILGMHADADNPELLRAQELELKIYSFPEFIYEQSRDKTRVVVAGTYGKTTITSMVMHVLKTLNRSFDYVVGAQLEGFQRLVHLTSDNPIIIIEGDEYFASSIDHRSKFHLYHPNIALISNVEWDNFKSVISRDDYYNQFRIFIDTIVSKGTLVYNKEDKVLQSLVGETMACKINRHGYKSPEYTINKGITYLHNGDEEIALHVFGKFNLSNIAGAYTVCEWLGVKKQEFFDAIRSFKSSIRYLEFVASQDGSVVYQDFAHTPPKLRSSIHAVKEQFPKKELVAVIELNAYDSLNKDLLEKYVGTMDEADIPIVFVNKESFKEKGKNIDNIEEDIRISFANPTIRVILEISDLNEFLEGFRSKDYNLLFMSSSNYSGVNMVSFADKFFKND